MAGVRGRVVDATTKAPMSEALVLIEGERSSAPNEGTAADGRFSMEGVTPGERTLVIMTGSAFRMPERRQVTLVEGQVLDLGDVPLSPPRAPPGTIGAQVGQEGQQLVISQVLPEGPSALAGLQVGDVLLAVDGAPVTTPPEAFQRLRGAPGSTVVLKVRRAGAEQSLSVTRAT
jgi:S1-C subfamily serine protease